MSFAPTDYDYGEKSNYAFAENVTCANDEARSMFVEAYGHMLNYNHEQAIACFTATTELDNCHAWWGIAIAYRRITTVAGLGSGYDHPGKVMGHCTELEQDLIALPRHSGSRYCDDRLNLGNAA